jgi:hypothetical protein
VTNACSPKPFPHKIATLILSDPINFFFLSFSLISNSKKKKTKNCQKFTPTFVALPEAALAVPHFV